MSAAFTPWSALAGGVLIGLGLAGVLLGRGRIAGVSGVLGGLVRPRPGDLPWRVVFLLGMVMGGGAYAALSPESFDMSLPRTLPAVAVAGVLVGMGTRLGEGCTSGHGVCGMSRLSRRSLVATMAFMATGMITAVVVGTVWGRT